MDIAQDFTIKVNRNLCSLINMRQLLGIVCVIKSLETDAQQFLGRSGYVVQ